MACVPSSLLLTCLGLSLLLRERLALLCVDAVPQHIGCDWTDWYLYGKCVCVCVYVCVCVRERESMHVRVLKCYWTPSVIGFSLLTV